MNDNDAKKKIPPEELKQPKIKKSKEFWEWVKQEHKAGRIKDYREYESPLISLIKGKHYYVIEDPRKASIKCVSCPIPHGGILEAHLLTRYKVKDGVLYFDGKAVNETPEGFTYEKK